MIVVLVAVFIIAGVLAHLVFTGSALDGLRVMLHELRGREHRSTHPRIRARDLDVVPRRAVYGMYVVWVALSALVVVLAIARLA